MANDADRSATGPILLMIFGSAAPVVYALTAGSPANQPGPTAAAPASGSAPAAKASADVKGPAAEIPAERLETMKPLPAVFVNEANPITEEKVTLGRMLFFEKRLSKNHDVSCNSCHDLAKFGVDGKPVSEGHKGQKGGRNSPTVYNAAVQFVQFWDGRAKDVEQQAGGPIVNPVEMAMPDQAAAVAVLSSIPEYVEHFGKAFPGDKDPVTYANLEKAIGAFERKLVTPGRWDAFLGGKKDAITADEKKGFNVFFEAGCTTCHNGPGVGGGSYQKLGAVKAWPNQKDQGRFEVTKADADKLMFKVPTLRNVAHTAPYFHDASAKTLEEAVRAMAEHQLGKKLTDEEVKLVVGWLGTLSSDPSKLADYVKEPALPKSGEKTPKADPN